MDRISFTDHILWPTLFVATVGGTILYAVNSDQGRKYTTDGYLDRMKKMRAEPDNWWYQMPDGSKLYFGIFGLNAIVFGIWNLL